MTTIEYVITDELGIHARPAGQLVKVASGFSSKVQIGASTENMVDAKRVMGVMRLAIKQGDSIIMTVDGEDEKEAAESLINFLKENL